MNLDRFEQNVLLPVSQLQTGQNLPLHHLARTNGMFYILLDVFGERAPVMQIGGKFHNTEIVGDLRTDLFNEFKQTFGMGNSPLFPSFTSHIDDVFKRKMSLNHNNLLSSVYLDPPKTTASPPKISSCTVTSSLSPVNLN